MNSFDGSIISFLNGFAHRSWTLDTFVYLLTVNSLLKAGVISAALWWAWFRRGESRTENREFILYGLIACCLAVFLARGLALMLPFRERPLRNPALHFQLPYSMSATSLLAWSSFPSDHAALFFALGTTLLFVCRRTGIFALSYVFFAICLPRIYLGIHYPTDILVGALIGIGTASLSKIAAIRTATTRPAMRWLHRHPGSFYTCFFLLTYQIASVFFDLREIGRFFSTTVKALVKLLR